MLERLPRPGFSLDLLIAEARRRARQRRFLVALLVLTLAGGGTGLVFGGIAVYRAATGIRAPYEPGYFGIETGLCCVTSYPAVSSVSVQPGGGAWIVGSSVAWRWDGTAWRSVPLPKVYGGGLESVASVSAKDAWAVGWAGNWDAGVASRGLIEHWDGIRWSVVRPLTPRGSKLSTVSASGPRNVWAAGAYGSKGERFHAARPLLLHWNGTTWSRVTVPWSRRGLGISSVSAVGSSGVWATATTFRGDGPVAPEEYYWNGRRWRSVPRPFGPKDPMSAFSAAAGNDAWAVGNYRAGGSSVPPLSAHWDGRSWRVVPVPEAPGYNFSELHDVADVSPTDAWAVGVSARIVDNSGTGPLAILFHWDGKAWHLTPGPPLRSSFTPLAIAAGRDGSAWAIGSCQADNAVFRWTHGTWVATNHPRDSHWSGGFGAEARRRHEALPTCTPQG